MESKTKTPAPPDSNTWRLHWEVMDRIEAMVIEALFDDNGRGDEAATSLGLLLEFIDYALYRIALTPPSERNELARSIAGALLADHYAGVLRSSDAARRVGKHSHSSKIWKLTHGVKGAPANEIFKDGMNRPVKRKGRSTSAVANWLRVEIITAASQHARNPHRLHSSGLKLPTDVGVFGSNEKDKDRWRNWTMSMLKQRFDEYADEPDHFREEAPDSPDPTWRNHQGSTAHDAFELEWQKHARRHQMKAKAPAAA